MNPKLEKIFKYIDHRYNEIGGHLWVGDFADDLGISIEDSDKVITKYLQNKEFFKGSIHLEESKITNLGNLKKVQGHLILTSSTNLTTINNLSYVGGLLNLYKTQVNELGNLKYAESIQLANTPYIDKLKEGYGKTIHSTAGVHNAIMYHIETQYNIKGRITI